MKRELEITTEVIDESSLVKQRKQVSECGAVVHFSGLVRESEGTDSIEALEYEVFQEMAEYQFKVLFDQIEAKWPIESVRVVHRVGYVPVGEPSLWVEVIASHRGEAFQACQYLIDEMKQVVPIWKRPVPVQENRASGKSR